MAFLRRVLQMPASQNGFRSTTQDIALLLCCFWRYSSYSFQPDLFEPASGAQLVLGIGPAHFRGRSGPIGFFLMIPTAWAMTGCSESAPLRVLLLSRRIRIGRRQWGQAKLFKEVIVFNRCLLDCVLDYFQYAMSRR